MLFDRVKYIMSFNGLEFEIEPPINWDESEKEFVRNETYHGILLNISNSIKFTGYSKIYLTTVLNDYGVNADVVLTRKIKNQEEEWVVDYVGHVDLLTASISDNIFEVKFNADSVINNFKSKLNSKIELESLTSIDADRELPPLEIDRVYLEGREILLKSFVQQGEDPLLEYKIKGEKSTYYQHYLPIAFQVLSKDDPNVHEIYNFDVVEMQQGDAAQNRYFYAADAVYSNSLGGAVPRDLRISVNVDIPIRIAKDEVRYFEVKVILFKGIYDSNKPGYLVNSERVLWSGDTNSTHISISSGEFIQHLEIDEALCLAIWTKGVYGNAIVFQGFDGEVNVSLGSKVNGVVTGQYLASMSFSEDSVRAATVSNCLRLYEVAGRLTESILNVPFSSKLCGLTREGYAVDGELSRTTMLHGMWLRGLTNGFERYKPISTSFREFFEAVNVIMPVGMSVSQDGVTLEKKESFYQNFVSIKLEGVTELVLELDASKHYSIINIGYNKAGGYEEEQGLDDYNRKTQYSTVLKVTNNELELISNYRTDTYGLETIRRENIEINTSAVADDDSKFDNDIWMLDTKFEGPNRTYNLSFWRDRFDEAPKNVYSPETAFNLWFSPINILLRHGAWIKPCVRQYLDSMIAFSSSEGNSSLITKLIGGKEYQQSIGVPVQDLNYSANKCIIAKFRAPASFEKLNGKTNGIPNVYGLVEFKYDGKKYAGHINRVSFLKGIGEFEVIIFN